MAHHLRSHGPAPEDITLESAPRQSKRRRATAPDSVDLTVDSPPGGRGSAPLEEVVDLSSPPSPAAEAAGPSTSTQPRPRAGRGGVTSHSRTQTRSAAASTSGAEASAPSPGSQFSSDEALARALQAEESARVEADARIWSRMADLARVEAAAEEGFAPEGPQTRPPPPPAQHASVSSLARRRVATALSSLYGLGPGFGDEAPGDSSEAREGRRPVEEDGSSGEEEGGEAPSGEAEGSGDLSENEDEEGAFDAGAGGRVHGRHTPLNTLSLFLAALEAGGFGGPARPPSANARSMRGVDPVLGWAWAASRAADLLPGPSLLTVGQALGRGGGRGGRGGRGGLPAHLVFSDRDFTEADYEALCALDEGVENRHGASREAIAALPVERLSARRVGQAADAQGDSPLPDSCVVCMERLGPGSRVKRLPCAHAFHPRCIDQWLRRKGSCPICQLDVRSR